MLFSLSESGVRTIATLIKRRLQNCPQTSVSRSPAVADCGVHLPGAQNRQPLKLPSFLCMWSWNELQWCSPSKGMHVVAELGAQHIRITCTPPTQPQTGTFQTLRSNNSRTAAPFFNLKAHFIKQFELWILRAERFPANVSHGSSILLWKKVIDFWAKPRHVRRWAMLPASLRKGHASL